MADRTVQGLGRAILRKLYARGCFGGKHTAFEHVMWGVPSHLHGAAKKAARDLMRDGLILAKPTSYGLQISLNPEHRAEIERIIASERI
jgi:hypothetical protein